MKKLIIVLLFLFTTLAMGKAYIKAEETETTISKEEVSLLANDKVTFSESIGYNKSNWVSTGYVTLNMGYSVHYTIDLNSITSLLENYDDSNVSSRYLQFYLGSYSTGVSEENQQWLSNHADWDVANKRLPLNASTTDVELQVWWNVIGQSGSAPSTGYPGGLRLYDIKYVVEYTVPVDIYTPISSWDDLPLGTMDMTNDLTIEDFFNAGQLYPFELDTTETGSNLYFNINSNLYKATDIQLPDAKNDKESIFNFYYATTTERFILMFYDINQENIWDSDFLIWNLTENKYNESFTQTVYGVSSVKGDGMQTFNMMFVDLVIPWSIDYILSMRIKYEYKKHYIIGDGEWITVKQQTLFENLDSPYELPYYRFWTRFVTNAVNQMFGENILTRSQIRDVTNEYDAQKKNEFTQKLNDLELLQLTPQNIFTPEATVHQLYLGQVNDTFTTGVSMKDIVLMNVRYMVNDVEYSFDFPPNIITDYTSPAAKERTMLEKVWAFLRSIWLIVAVFVSFYAVKMLTDIFPELKKQKNKYFKYAILAGSFYFLYFYVSFK